MTSRQRTDAIPVETRTTTAKPQSGRLGGRRMALLGRVVLVGMILVILVETASIYRTMRMAPTPLRSGSVINSAEPDLAAALERGHWSFAGGTYHLEVLQIDSDDVVPALEQFPLGEALDGPAAEWEASVLELASRRSRPTPLGGETLLRRFEAGGMRMVVFSSKRPDVPERLIGGALAIPTEGSEWTVIRARTSDRRAGTSSPEFLAALPLPADAKVMAYRTGEAGEPLAQIAMTVAPDEALVAAWTVGGWSVAPLAANSYWVCQRGESRLAAWASPVFATGGSRALLIQTLDLPRQALSVTQPHVREVR